MRANGVEAQPCEHDQHKSHDMGPSDADKQWLVDELQIAAKRIKFLEERQTELQELSTEYVFKIRDLEVQISIAKGVICI